MIMDYENRYSNDQAITATAASTKIVDLGDIDSKVQSHVKKGPIRLVVMCTEDFTNLTSLDIALRSAAAYTGTVDSATLTSSVTKLTKNVLLAGLKEGKVLIDQELPVGMDQYSDLYYTVNGSNPDAGKLTAFLVMDSQSNTVNQA